MDNKYYQYSEKWIEEKKECAWVDTSRELSIQQYALGMYAIGRSTMPPGSHADSPRVYYEIHIMRKGTVEFICGKEKKTLHEGDVAIVRPGEPCYYTNTGTGEVLRDYIMLHRGPLAGLLLDFGVLADRYSMKLPQPERVFEIADRIRRVCEVQDEFCMQSVSCACYELLTELARQSQWHEATSDFKRMIFIIARMPHRKYTLESMAKECGVSIRTLHNLFMKEKGCSPMEYVIRMRMQMAGYLLSKSNLPAADAAALCGYNNIPFFTREFKKFYGETPHAWTRKNKESSGSQPSKKKQ